LPAIGLPSSPTGVVNKALEAETLLRELASQFNAPH